MINRLFKSKDGKSTLSPKKYFFKKVHVGKNRYKLSSRWFKYSNDYATNQIVKRIASENSSWITDFFNNVFIGKTGHNKFSANALQVDNGEHYGFVAIYDVGFTIATEVWSQTFVHFLENFADNLQPGDSYLKDEKLRLFIDSVVDVFQSWEKTDEINLLDALTCFRNNGIKANAKAGVTISFALDEFAVAHEFAHHLLGDTGGGYVSVEDIDIIVSAVSNIPLHFGSDTEEHLADTFGIFLFTGTHPIKLFSDQSVKSMVDLPRAALGVLGILSLLALMSDDPYESAHPDYPAPNDRFNNAMAALSNLAVISARRYAHSGINGTELAEANSIRKDVMNFHDLLNRSRIERNLMVTVPRKN